MHIIHIYTRRHRHRQQQIINLNSPLVCQRHQIPNLSLIPFSPLPRVSETDDISVAGEIVSYTECISEELAENLMLLTNILMGRSDSRDRFRDWRLDTDDMTYEQLLALGEKMGYVSTGLKESEIQRCVKKTRFLGKTPSPFAEEAEPKCSICQEEYEPKDKLGTLICAHSYHRDCIKQWLRHKKTCPVCKSEVIARR